MKESGTFLALRSDCTAPHTTLMVLFIFSVVGNYAGKIKEGYSGENVVAMTQDGLSFQVESIQGALGWGGGNRWRRCLQHPCCRRQSAFLFSLLLFCMRRGHAFLFFPFFFSPKRKSLGQTAVSSNPFDYTCIDRVISYHVFPSRVLTSFYNKK